MNAHDDIEARAAEWIARQDTADGAHSAEFEAWLGESIAHRVAYLRLSAAWQSADRLVTLRTPPQPMAVKAPTPPSVPVYMRFAAGFVALAIAGAAWWGWLDRGADTSQTYATVLGGHETVALADGSKVELNTSTTMRADIANGRRTVWLDTGEAYFSVMHDAAHPFVIRAGDRSVTVLGTKFSVRRDGERVDVLVEEGRVTVRTGAGASALLAPGDEAVATGESLTRSHETPEALAAALSWRRGLLVFDQSTLADAAAEFNRYNQVKLIVADSKAANLRIGGTFGCNNVAGFVRLLHSGFNLRADVRGGAIFISS